MATSPQVAGGAGALWQNRSPLVARCTELSSLAPGVVHPPKSLCDSCCSHSTTAGLSCSPQLPRVGIHGNSSFLMFFVNFHWSGELVCSLRCHTNICSERQASVEAVRLSLSAMCARVRACRLSWARCEMMMRPSVPHRCVFCHSAGSVVVAMSIWHGALARCWHCRTCERDWPLNPGEQQAFNRRAGPGDRRRATRTDRRGRQL
jgi:hypothetical protein